MNLPQTADSPAEQRCILLLPGWQGSGPDHWQCHWARRPGHQLLEQSDWIWPRRGDWMAQLEESILQSDAQVALVAHSLGCHLVSAWAAHSRHSDRVLAAMLVAPPDLEQPGMPPNLYNWRPVLRQRLPFTSRIVASSNDPYASLRATASLAASWGSTLTVVGDCGHVNAESGLGDWEQGRMILESLLRDTDGGLRGQ